MKLNYWISTFYRNGLKTGAQRESRWVFVFAKKILLIKGGDYVRLQRSLF